MYRLLIVDDEPYTVDGLYEMLDEADLPDMDLYRAYTAEEALERLSGVRMDIVLSDIRMPGMDGLELQRVVRRRWPMCKFIFLTGLNDLDSVRQAMRDGGADYILKTEGDEPILEAIRKAVKTLEQEYANDRHLTAAQEQLRKALPVVRNEWFRRLLQDGMADAGWNQAKLDELECPLRAERPVLLAMLRIDSWPQPFSVSDRQLLAYALENIVQELFAPAVSQLVSMDESMYLLLVQPGDEMRTWQELADFMRGSLETVQSTCGKLLKLTVSAAGGSGPVDWDELPDAGFALRKALFIEAVEGQLIWNADSARSGGRAGTSQPEESPQARREKLDAALERGDAEEVRRLISNWLLPSVPYAVYMENYFTIAARLLGMANRLGGEDGVLSDARVDQLMNVQAHTCKPQAIEFLQSIAEQLMERQRQARDESVHRVIDKVHRIIRERLAEDVSLTALAEAVYLNPTYLSELYKRITGSNLSDTIASVRMERAKELLADSSMKIHEIAASIGFENAGYFTRFFRKHAGMGPQEYRNQNIRT